MVQGIVKWFDSKKGYGFITRDDDSTDVFVHFSAIEGGEEEFKTIYQGDKVEFEIVDGEKGPQASKLTIIEKAPRPSFKGRRRSY
jgi:CspA family cold shock protein